MFIFLKDEIMSQSIINGLGHGVARTDILFWGFPYDSVGVTPYTGTSAGLFNEESKK